MQRASEFDQFLSHFQATQTRGPTMMVFVHLQKRRRRLSIKRSHHHNQLCMKIHRRILFHLWGVIKQHLRTRLLWGAPKATQDTHSEKYWEGRRAAAVITDAPHQVLQFSLDCSSETIQTETVSWKTLEKLRVSSLKLLLIIILIWWLSTAS